MKVADRILVITDILLAALHSDATMNGIEADAARKLIADLLLKKRDSLPAEVEKRIQEFRLLDFDINKAVAAFLQDPPMRRRRLLELVGQMVAADGEISIGEDDFMRSLARALGMGPEEYADLVLDYEISRIRESFRELTAVGSNAPPPIPPGARMPSAPIDVKGED